MGASASVGFMLSFSSISRSASWAALALVLPLCFTPGLTAQGAVSLPVDHKLAELLQDADLLFEQGEIETALSLLRQVAQANPTSVIQGSDPALHIGAAHTAQQRLLKWVGAHSEAEPSRFLPSPFTEAQAREALSSALRPPHRGALARVVRQFPATEAAQRAKRLWRELALDRGSVEAGSAPQDWPVTWRNLDDSTFYATPFVQHGQDPKLPMVWAKDLSPAWSFHFQSNWLGQARHHRVLSRDGFVWASDGVECAALSLATGQKIWQFQAPESWKALQTDQLDSLFSAVDSDFLHTPVLSEGVLLIVLQEAFALGRKDDFRRDISVRRSLPARRLYAFDAQTGDLLWVQKVPWMTSDGKPQLSSEARALVAGPPAVLDGRVFLPVYNAVGTLDVSLLALDLHTGRELWKTFLVSGVKETNLFGNILLELACPPPVAKEQTVYLLSGLGAVSAVDAATGTSLWTRTYPRTPLRTYQSGRESDRAVSFTLEPPALGKDSIVFAPTDAKEVFSLDPKTGGVQKTWSAITDDRFIRQLLGASPHGIWFSGPQAGFLSKDGFQGQSWTSPTLFDHYWRFDAIRGGFLSRGRIAANSPIGLQSFHATTGEQGFTHPHSSETQSLGDFQALDGHLVALRSNGFDVLKSNRDLLAALKSAERGALAWPSLLTLFVDFDFSSVTQLWVRQFQEALDSAYQSQPHFQVQPMSSVWHLVAGRVASALGETAQAISHFDAALVDKKSARIVLQALLTRAPQSDAFEKAVRLLDGSPPDAARVAQAKVIQSIAMNQPEKARVALVKILQLDSAQAHHAWAQERLSATLSTQRGGAGTLLQTHENEAQTALLSQIEISEGFLRAYGQTQVVATTLQERLALDLQDGQLADLLSARAVRDLSPKVWASMMRSFQGDIFAEAHSLPELPPILAAQETFTLPADDLLALRLHNNDIRALMQSATGPQWFGSSPDDHGQWFTEPELKPRGPSLPESLLQQLPQQKLTHLPTSDGQLFFTPSRLVHFGFDHSVRVTTLPNPIHFAMPPISLGKLCAFFTLDENQEIVLEIRELSSGHLWMKRELHLNKNTHLRRIQDGRFLFLLASRLPKAQRIDLHGVLKDAFLPLPFAPAAYELAAISVRDSGLLLPQDGEIHFVQVEHSRSFPPNGMTQALPFPAGHGGGWLHQPLVPGTGSTPSPALSWWPSQNQHPQVVSFQEPRRAFPQLRASVHHGVRDLGEHLFSVIPEQDGSTRLELFELGAQRIKRIQSVSLSGLPFAQLLLDRFRVYPLSDGWLVSVPCTLPTRNPTSQLHLLRLDAKGLLLSQWDTSPELTPERPRRVRIVGQRVLLLDGSTLCLFF